MLRRTLVLVSCNAVINAFHSYWKRVLTVISSTSVLARLKTIPGGWGPLKVLKNKGLEDIRGKTKHVHFAKASGQENTITNLAVGTLLRFMLCC